MDSLSPWLDLLLVIFQVLAVLFLAYGGYLALRGATVLSARSELSLRSPEPGKEGALMPEPRPRGCGESETGPGVAFRGRTDLVA